MGQDRPRTDPEVIHGELVSRDELVTARPASWMARAYLEHSRRPGPEAEWVEAELVNGIPPPTDTEILDHLLGDVRDVLGQLEDMGPRARELGRWLRTRVGQHMARRIGRRW